MARRRKNKPATFYREGFATYNENGTSYRYEVWKNSNMFFITFGQKGPFTQTEREEDIDAVAHTALNRHIRRFIEESEKRLKAHYFGESHD